MSDIKYPVVRCFNPRKIVNPYTGQSMTVPCGHCRACALQRSNHLSLWCDLESQSHKYCMFVTLTYSNRFIPRCQILDSTERPFGHDLVTSDGEILGTCDIAQSEIDKFLEKVYLFGSVPYLRKEDLQKFLKRFRYYVSKTSKAKVRYFACGEYGPLHFRPHYHLLLWFDDDAILQVCEQAVLQAWPFGRVDVQLSRGSCSNYVAGYVNSSCALPKVLTARAVRPFVTHSSRLGYAILQSQRKEIYECSAADFIKTGLLINGKYREFSLWRAFYAYYFPKCKGYTDKSSYARLQSYRIYDTARKAFPDCSGTPSALAKGICSCAYYFGDKKSTFFDIATREVITYFYDYEACQQKDMSSDVFQKWVQRVYNELLLSRHFLYDLIGTPTLAACKSFLKKIEDFYTQLDYYHLTEFFETQSQFYLNNFYGSDDLMSINSDSLSFFPYFYDNVNYNYENYKATPVYQMMTSEVMRESYQRMKHKVQNDANMIFCESC